MFPRHNLGLQERVRGHGFSGNARLRTSVPTAVKIQHDPHILFDDRKQLYGTDPVYTLVKQTLEEEPYGAGYVPLHGKIVQDRLICVHDALLDKVILAVHSYVLPGLQGTIEMLNCSVDEILLVHDFEGCRITHQKVAGGVPHMPDLEGLCGSQCGQ